MPRAKLHRSLLVTWVSAALAVGFDCENEHFEFKHVFRAELFAAGGQKQKGDTPALKSSSDSEEMAQLSSSSDDLATNFSGTNSMSLMAGIL